MNFIILYPPLSPITSIEIPIPDGFGYMMVMNLFLAFEVGNGAGNLKDAVIGTG